MRLMKQETHSIKYGNGNNNDIYIYHHWILTVDINKKALDSSKIIQEQNKKSVVIHLLEKQ
jgi:predicted naringenin-chalcone synthase